MRVTCLLPRFLALFVALCLALPGPALALRNLEPVESGLEEQIARRLGLPSAGLEEKVASRPATLRQVLLSAGAVTGKDRQVRWALQRALERLRGVPKSLRAPVERWPRIVESKLRIVRILYPEDRGAPVDRTALARELNALYRRLREAVRDLKRSPSVAGTPKGVSIRVVWSRTRTRQGDLRLLENALKELAKVDPAAYGRVISTVRVVSFEPLQETAAVSNAPGLILFGSPFHAELEGQVRQELAMAALVQEAAHDEFQNRWWRRALLTRQGLGFRHRLKSPLTDSRSPYSYLLEVDGNQAMLETLVRLVGSTRSRSDRQGALIGMILEILQKTHATLKPLQGLLRRRDVLTQAGKRMVQRQLRKQQELMGQFASLAPAAGTEGGTGHPPGGLFAGYLQQMLDDEEVRRNGWDAETLSRLGEVLEEALEEARILLGEPVSFDLIRVTHKEPDGPLSWVVREGDRSVLAINLATRMEAPLAVHVAYYVLRHELGERIAFHPRGNGSIALSEEPAMIVSGFKGHPYLRVVGPRPSADLADPRTPLGFLASGGPDGRSARVGDVVADKVALLMVGGQGKAELVSRLLDYSGEVTYAIRQGLTKSEAVDQDHLIRWLASLARFEGVSRGVATREASDTAEGISQIAGQVLARLDRARGPAGRTGAQPVPDRGTYERLVGEYAKLFRGVQTRAVHAAAAAGGRAAGLEEKGPIQVTELFSAETEVLLAQLPTPPPGGWNPRGSTPTTRLYAIARDPQRLRSVREAIGGSMTGLEEGEDLGTLDYGAEMLQALMQEVNDAADDAVVEEEGVEALEVYLFNETPALSRRRGLRLDLGAEASPANWHAYILHAMEEAGIGFGYWAVRAQRWTAPGDQPAISFFFQPAASPKRAGLEEPNPPQRPGDFGRAAGYGLLPSIGGIVPYRVKPGDEILPEAEYEMPGRMPLAPDEVKPGVEIAVRQLQTQPVALNDLGRFALGDLTFRIVPMGPDWKGGRPEKKKGKVAVTPMAQKFLLQVWLGEGREVSEEEWEKGSLEMIPLDEGMSVVIGRERLPDSLNPLTEIDLEGEIGTPVSDARYRDLFRGLDDEGSDDDRTEIRVAISYYENGLDKVVYLPRQALTNSVSRGGMRTKPRPGKDMSTGGFLPGYHQPGHTRVAMKGDEVIFSDLGSTAGTRIEVRGAQVEALTAQTVGSFRERWASGETQVGEVSVSQTIVGSRQKGPTPNRGMRFPYEVPFRISLKGDGQEWAVMEFKVEDGPKEGRFYSRKPLRRQWNRRESNGYVSQEAVPVAAQARFGEEASRVKESYEVSYDPASGEIIVLSYSAYPTEVVPLEETGSSAPAAGLEENPYRLRIPEVVDQFTLVRSGDAALTQRAGYLLEGEGLIFSPVFALSELRTAFRPLFAGVVESRQELEALIQIFAAVPQIHDLLRERLVVAEEQPAKSDGEKYALALAEAKRKLLAVADTVIPVTEREPDLLAQLVRYLEGVGYHLPDDPAARDAALTLLRAA